MKQRIIFDNNILNKLVDLYKNNPNSIDLIAEKFEILNCDTLIRECENIKFSNIELYNKVIPLLNKFTSRKSAVFSLIDWNNKSNLENTIGFGDLNNTEQIETAFLSYEDVAVYENIHPNAKAPKKESDRQIALIASAHNADLIITNDHDFISHLNRTNINNMTFEKFCKTLNIEVKEKL